jgi:hypothetical protein
VNAKKCDVCGALYERDTVQDVTINKYIHGYGTERLDLCQVCQQKLEDWIKSADENGL